jgi:predicted nucleic acid-binding protein
MYILVDTNILLRSVELIHPQHQIAIGALATLRVNGHEPVLVPQVVYEFWAVATRPVSLNGLGLDPALVDAAVDDIMQAYPIYDDRGVLDLWRSLVVRYAVLGKLAHDARLVAAMLRHGVTHLLTFNAPDFARFQEVAALDPTAAALPPAG